MKKTNPKNMLLSAACIGACAGTAVFAQVGGEPVCLDTEFLRMACDNLAQESSPECNDIILDGDDDPVLDTISAVGCGNKQRTSSKVKCIRAVYIYNPQTGSCEYSHNHEDLFSSNFASGDGCGAC